MRVVAEVAGRERRGAGASTTAGERRGRRRGGVPAGEAQTAHGETEVL